MNDQDINSDIKIPSIEEIENLKEIIEEYSFSQLIEVDKKISEYEQKLESKSSNPEKNKKIILKFQEKIEELISAKKLIAYLQEKDSTKDYFSNQELDDLNNQISQGKVQFLNKEIRNLENFSFETLKDFYEYKEFKENEQKSLREDQEEINLKIIEELKDIEEIIDIFEENDFENTDDLQDEIENLPLKIEEAIENKKTEKFINKHKNYLEKFSKILEKINKYNDLISQKMNNQNEDLNTNSITGSNFNSRKTYEDSKQKEEYLTYIEDGLLLIECSEKYFNLIIGALFFINQKEKLDDLIIIFKKNPNINNHEDKINLLNNFLDKKTILQNFDNLKTFLKIEGLLTSEIRSEIDSAINNFDLEFIDISLGNLEKIFRRYRILNIQELKRLIKNIDDAGNIIKNQDIILLLGDTGSGKSTTAQFILGMKMEKKEIDGLTHIEGNLEEYIKRKSAIYKNPNPSEIKIGIQNNNTCSEKVENNLLLNQLKNLKSSCFMRSETRYINAIPMYINNQSFYLCDTPGFRDSNGTEVNIANSVTIIKAIHLAKSVRPIILISEKGIGDRGIDLKNYAINIKKIIPNLKSLNLKINFIITKFKKKDKIKLRKLLVNLNQNLSKAETLNESYEEFIYVLKYKLDCLHSDYIVDPLKDDYNCLLDHIKNTSAIENPTENFNYFLEEKAIKDINEQFCIHTKVIENCLTDKRFDIVNFKLDEMKFLYESTNNKKLKIKYEEVEKNILDHVNRVSKNIEEKVEFLIKQEDEINAESINSIKELISIIQKAQIFKEVIKIEFLPSVNQSENFIQEKLTLLSNEISNSDNLNDKILSRIKKLNAFCEHFSSFNSILEHAKEIINKKIISKLDEIKFILSESNKNLDAIFECEKFKNLIDNLDDLLNLFKAFIYDKNKNINTEDLINECYKLYREKFNKCIYYLKSIKEKKPKKKTILSFGNQSINQNNISDVCKEDKNLIVISNNENDEISEQECEIRFINQYFEEIEKISNKNFNVKNSKLDIKEKFSSLAEECIKNITGTFIDLEKESTNLLLKNDLNNFELAGNEILKMQTLTKIDKTSKNLEKNFLIKIIEISDYLKSLMKNIKKDLNNILSNKVNINYKIVSNFIKNIDKLDWIQEFKKFEFEKFKEDLEEIVITNMDCYIDIILDSDLNLDEFENLKDKEEAYEKLSKIKNIFPEYGYLISKIIEPIKMYEDSITDIKKEIVQVFNLLKIDNNINSNNRTQENNTISEEQNIDSNLNINNNDKISEYFISSFKNLARLEKCAKFLVICKSFKNKKYKGMELFKKFYLELKLYLENLYDFFVNKLENIYKNLEEFIKYNNSSNENENELNKSCDYFKNIEIFKVYLNFFKRFNKNYEIIELMMDPKKAIDHILETTIKELYNCFLKEINYYKEEQKLSQLKSINTLIRETIFLDEYKFHDQTRQERFNKLYEDSVKYLKEKIPDLEKQFDENFEKNEYDSIENILRSLEETNDITTLKFLEKNRKKLKNHLEEKLGIAEKYSLDYIAKDNKIENAEELKKNMKLIYKLFKITDSFLLTEEKENYKLKLENIKTEISKKFHDELYRLGNLDLKESNIEDRINYMYLIKKYVKDCFDNVSDNLRKDFEYLEKILTKIEDEIREKINEFKGKKLKDMNIKSLEKLKNKIDKIKPSLLEDEFDILINNSIDEAKSQMEKTINSSYFKEIERYIKQFFKLLDEDQKSKINEDLKKLNEDLIEKLNCEEKEIINYTENNDYQNLYIISDFIFIREKKISKNLENVKNFLFSKIKEILKSLDDSIKEYNIQEYFKLYHEHITGILKFKNIFKIEVSEFKKIEKLLLNYKDYLNIIDLLLENTNIDLKYYQDDDSTPNPDSNIKDNPRNKGKFLIQNDVNEDSYLQIILAKNENQKFSLKADLKKNVEEKRNCFHNIIFSTLDALKYINSHQRNKCDENNIKDKKNNDSREINNDFLFLGDFQENFKALSFNLINKISMIYSDSFENFKEYLSTYDFEKIIFYLLKLYIMDYSFFLINDNINEIKSIYVNDSQFFEKIKIYKPYIDICRDLTYSFENIELYFKNLDIQLFTNTKNDIDSLIKIIDNKIQIFINIQYLEAIPNYPKMNNDYYSKAKRILNEKLNPIHSFLIKIITNINPNTTKEEQDNIYNFIYFYEKFGEINNDLKQISISFLDNFEKVQEAIFEERRKNIETFSQEKKLEDISDELISLKLLILNYSKKEKHYNSKLSIILLSIKEKVGMMGISKIGYLIDKHPQGRLLIQSNKIFEGFEIQLFNSRTQNHDEKYFIENLVTEGDKVSNKDRLTKSYIKFKEFYENLLKKHLVNLKYVNNNNLSTELKDKFFKAKLTLFHEGFNLNNLNWKGIIDDIPELLAYIFAEWTITNASSFFEAEECDDRDTYLLKPHPAQIISIFRILKIDQRENIENHLVQIKTGEGKSVVLGVLSSFFALLGINVYVACYSQYLSDRDFNYFSPIFESLAIFQKINYGTFNNLCESLLKKKIDVRSSVENFIKRGILNDSRVFKQKNEINILLIDEVDVFFSKDFFGNIYSPSIKLKDPSISKLLDKLWNYRDKLKYFKFEELQKSDEYLDCLNKFKDFSNLIESCVLNVIHDLKNYKDHDYNLIGNQIGYKEHDNYVFNVNYGYKTMFAYYLEHNKNKIDYNNLEDKKAFIIKCGYFAFAEVPKFFDFILGVTGTLMALNSEENKIMEEIYNIKNKTFSPSVYGKSQFIFDESKNVIVVGKSDYFKIIADHTERGLSGSLKGTKRAVLVFFENKKILQEFHSSKYFSKIKYDSKILTEETDKQEKERCIRFSTLSGSITLLTRVFGRGTDFISNDETVINQGGIHIIQTFFSEHLSEEIQIQGRTARQGQTGTYELILNEDDLEKFGYKKEISNNYDNESK